MATTPSTRVQDKVKYPTRDGRPVGESEAAWQTEAAERQQAEAALQESEAARQQSEAENERLWRALEELRRQRNGGT